MDAEKVERIVTDTQGYPHLLESEVDDEIHGQSSALSRELFFERTTQWMSAQQKQWAVRIAFLDEISLEIIPRVIPNVDPEAVLAWFKREASLRAPVADRWSMRPMISKIKCTMWTRGICFNGKTYALTDGLPKPAKAVLSQWCHANNVKHVIK
ncbi:hypothetical protein BH11MYX2_BH11MYX2_19530 [soil metagenome]